jgi:hypothetical protein
MHDSYDDETLVGSIDREGDPCVVELAINRRDGDSSSHVSWSIRCATPEAATRLLAGWMFGGEGGDC